MTGEPGVDYPDEKMPVDVRAESRGDTLLSFVEGVASGEVVLTVGEDRDRRRVRLEPGERLELVWRGPAELRAVPAELVAVTLGGSPTWRVRTVGPAGRGQRRAAVRAPMSCTVTVTLDGRTFEGMSVDLSEGGLRCLLGAAPDSDHSEDDTVPEAAPAPRLEVGAVPEIAVRFDDGEQVTARAEVVRRYPRDDRREEVSLRFVGLPEKKEDLIRTRVFARLRDLRARGLL